MPWAGFNPGGETPISLEKERVTINAERISVEYELLNPTGQEITTEVLLPLPGEDAYSLADLAPPPIAHWNFWVEGKEVQYETEVRATDENGVDRTALLRRFPIDIASFGHFNRQPDGKVTGDLAKLSRSQKEELTGAGLLAGRDFPTWIVFKTFHWQQRFPAHSILHAKMEYSSTPGLGAS
jgi:hypothetical protein